MEENSNWPEATGKNVADGILASVKERIKSSGETVIGNVVQALADIEINKRVDLVLRGIERRESIEKELRKIKPDQKSFDGEGRVVSESYSEGAYNNKKKAEENLSKLNSALEAALNSNDYDKLAKALG